jgi:phage baseplate assembly protein V
MGSLITLSRLVVEVDGQPLAAEDASSLGEVRIHQRLSQPTLCELVFIDPVGALKNAAALMPGTSLRVAVLGDRIELFSGEVTAVEYMYGPAQERHVVVRGYDLLHRLRKHQPVCAHVQVTPAELAQEMIGKLGLQVEAVESGPLWQRIIQFQHSDLDLLIETAERSGLYFALRGQTLHIFTLQGFGDVLPLSLGASLFEARIEINGHHSCRSVVAMGWDPWRVEARAGRADVPRSGRYITAEVTPEQIGATGEQILTAAVVQDDRQAEALAQAHLDVRAGQEVILWGVAEGNAQLRPGTLVEISGGAPPLNGQYVLTSVNHMIDVHRGFISEVTTEPPPQRQRTNSTLTAWGVVTNADDPDGLGRVRALLPAFGDVETDWMSVLAVGAGASKGLLMIPEVGDSVLIFCANGDLAQGVVMGGLYGTQKLPCDAIEGGARQHYTLRTPGGQVVRLDDQERTLRFENSAGSFLELRDGKVLLHATANLEIEAPGQFVIIRGAKIDFQRR